MTRSATPSAIELADQVAGFAGWSYPTGGNWVAAFRRRDGLELLIFREPGGLAVVAGDRRVLSDAGRYTVAELVALLGSVVRPRPEPRS